MLAPLSFFFLCAVAPVGDGAFLIDDVRVETGTSLTWSVAGWVLRLSVTLPTFMKPQLMYNRLHLKQACLFQLNFRMAPRLQPVVIGVTESQ